MSNYYTKTETDEKIATMQNNIENNSKWKLAGTANGSTEISLPSNYSELHIVINTNAHILRFITNKLILKGLV